jgi:predicted metal-dependent hydrolase
VIEWLRSAGLKQAAALDPQVEVAGRSLPIAIRRHPNARRLTMRLAPAGDELRITMPSWGRTKDALAFAQSRTSWIETQLAKVPVAEDLAPGARIAFRGGQLTVAWEASALRKPRREGDVIHLGGPEARIEQRLRHWLDEQALALLAEDLAHYCARAGHAPPALQLSRARRRWGSCASVARGACIRINWRLVMAPDHVRRSVVAHEVAHLTHFDHSPAFHAHLAEVFDGDLAAADLWLKREGPSLYSQFA